jgi:hippurate hydrolase
MKHMPATHWASGDLEELVAFRRDLHAHPELLYDVERTAARVAEALRSAGLDEVVTGLGRTGVVGVIRGKGRGRRGIGLRADMDALPIHEASGVAWESTRPGVMHACGHDGHTAMLLGAARHLARTRDFSGKVYVIFQPAEEGGAGAKAMIDDGLFDRFRMNEVYGLHNRPGLAVGRFAIASGPAMAAVDEIYIRIEGRGGHAAYPHHTVDPVPVTAAIIQALQAIVSRNVDPLKSAVVSISTIHGGDAFNVVPQAIEMSGTVRTLDAQVRDRIEARLHETVTGVAAAFGASAVLSYTRCYPAMVNHSRNAILAMEAAREVAGKANVMTDPPPSLGGEDFAFMLQQCPGAMIFAGNGPSAGLHHPAYDFNDESIPWGCAYWTTLVGRRLPLA